MVQKETVQKNDNRLEKLSEKIITTRKVLNNTYINVKLDYERKLEVSQNMDELIIEYYRLKENKDIKDE